MVQDKNFQGNKKGMNATQDLDKKNQSSTADRSADSARTGINQQSGLSKDKADISKRDVNSRK